MYRYVQCFPVLVDCNLFELDTFYDILKLPDTELTTSKDRTLHSLRNYRH